MLLFKVKELHKVVWFLQKKQRTHNSDIQVINNIFNNQCLELLGQVP